MGLNGKVSAPEGESSAENNNESVVTTFSNPFASGLLFQEPDESNAIRVTRVVEDDELEDEVDEPAPKPARRSSKKEESGKNRQSKNSSGSDKNKGRKSSSDSAGDDEADGSDSRPRRRRRSLSSDNEVSAPRGSTRLAAKRQRRKDSRDAGRRRHVVTEVEYLARREAVKREMLVREEDGLNQIAVLEDGVLVEHYVARHTQVSMVGNVYLGRVQNVLPSMEAAFVDIGKGRNAVLYAGEVDWAAAGVTGKNKRIEQALKSGDTVLVQVTKNPIGHKGARLTSQVTLAGRHLVLVPGGQMTGISRKLPEKERRRLKKLLREIVPEEHGVIVRTAAEGATAEQLAADVERLSATWKEISEKSKNTKGAPKVLKEEPELAVRVVRDIFNEDFESLRVQGDDAFNTISRYVKEMSPELTDRVSKWTERGDIFAENRVDEQLAKAFDRKVWLPSGGTLIIDRTEAMTVIDVNTGKFTGSGGSLEETVTRNNLEAAEEIVRQLRLRDIGGIIVIDFIDMVLESNQDLVQRRLVECLGRDRTRHQVSEVTSLGLIQMTRKRVGQGLVEAFSTPCEACDGRGYIIHDHAVEKGEPSGDSAKRKKRRESQNTKAAKRRSEAQRSAAGAAMNSIAQAGHGEKDPEGEAQAEHSGAVSSGETSGNGHDRGGNRNDRSGNGRNGVDRKDVDRKDVDRESNNGRGPEEVGTDSPSRDQAGEEKASGRKQRGDSRRERGERSKRAARTGRKPLATSGQQSEGAEAPAAKSASGAAKHSGQAAKPAGSSAKAGAADKPRAKRRGVLSSGVVTPKKTKAESGGAQRLITAAPSGGLQITSGASAPVRGVLSSGTISTGTKQRGTITLRRGAEENK